MDVRQVDWLTDYNYLGEKILAPALAYAKGRQLITARESSVLEIIVERSCQGGWARHCHAGDVASLADLSN